MPSCKLCLQDRVLIRAHILPDAFNRDLRGGAERPPVMLANNPEEFPKRLPGGHYDENLLCEECELRFNKWDDYAAEFFLNRLRNDGRPIVAPEGDIIAYQYDDVDYERLKLFAISLLWRAAETQIRFFNRVKIGPYREAARQLVLTADPGAPDTFSVLVCRWRAKPSHEGIAQAQFSPYCARVGGVNDAKFFFAGAVLHTKVDKRPYPAPLQEMILRPGSPFAVLTRELEGSKDILAVRPGLEAHAARLRR